ncbi:unnamed protein product [Oikopleura dioica]|uniref:Uncharacterized protein n=1 Tax=Oikopleura dioica TaxID=34765 RepID=E4WXK1_OIKDI|nr:unnamed protein product [Oikopleura dioica]
MQGFVFPFLRENLVLSLHLSSINYGHLQRLSGRTAD